MSFHCLIFHQIIGQWGTGWTNVCHHRKVHTRSSTKLFFKKWQWTRQPYITFYGASNWLPPYWYHKVERSLVCVEGYRRIIQSGLTQDIKMGSCVFQCDVPHKWITQDRSAPCLYAVTEWGVMSCVCSMAFLCGSTLVKVPLLQADTIAIWPQMFKSDVEIKQTNKSVLMITKKVIINSKSYYFILSTFNSILLYKCVPLHFAQIWFNGVCISQIEL